jgi:pimeloyl-ACP methyl ester carboxylesterase
MAVAELEMTASRDGTPIAFEFSGEGPALILMGGTWNDRHTPAELADRLSADFTVYRYDRRDRGDSGFTAPYSVDGEIEDLVAVIEAAGGSAHAFGHSSGGALALEATAAGAPISKLAIYEAPYITDDSRPPLPGDYIERLDELIAADDRREVFEYFMTVAVGMPAEMVQPMLDSPMADSMLSLAHTVPYDGRVMLEGSMRGQPLPTRWTKTVTIPSLVMDGGNSPAWIRNSARGLVAVLPDVQYRTLEGQDHAAAPEVVAPELKRFLA